MIFYGKCVGFSTDSREDWDKHMEELHPVDTAEKEEAHWLGVRVRTSSGAEGQVWSLGSRRDEVAIAVRRGKRNTLEAHPVWDLEIL